MPKEGLNCSCFQSSAYTFNLFLVSFSIKNVRDCAKQLKKNAVACKNLILQGLKDLFSKAFDFES